MQFGVSDLIKFKLCMIFVTCIDKDLAENAFHNLTGMYKNEIIHFSSLVCGKQLDIAFFCLDYLRPKVR